VGGRASAAAACLIAVLALVVAGANGEAASVAAKGGPAKKALKALVRQTSKLPADAAPKPKRRALLRSAGHAKRSAAKKPCTAVNDLDKFRRVLEKVKVKSGRRHATAAEKLAALGPASVEASRILLTGPGTESCGGGVQAAAVDEPTTTVLQSDENGLTVKVDLPELQFVPEVAGGQSWSRLALAGTGTGAADGAPGIPVVASDFAVPDGADVSVDVSDVQSYTLKGVDVFPQQPDVVDADTPAPDFDGGPYAAAPFAFDRDAYAASDGGPVAGALVLGSARDVLLGALRLPTAQFIAPAKTLTVTTSATVHISFLGGPHTFAPVLTSPWERPTQRLLTTLLNGDLLRRSPISTLFGCGEEMLVVTNSSTRSAADTFAAAKRNAGMRTKVVEVGSGAGQIGSGAGAIQNYIRGELTASGCIHPSYVTILGDDDLVPTFVYGADDPFLDNETRIPSDLPYSLRDDKDLLPDVAVGRILGNDNAAVTTVVNKIIGYETNPPTGDFLNHAMVAAQFQDTDAPGQKKDGQENRTFVQFAETVRTGIAARGVTVDRLYRDSPTAKPRRFEDGTDLPAELRKPKFKWNATRAGVTNAWNAGPFLIIHRDHGWSDGWGKPDFGTADVQALTNGTQLPVLMSINCASARYDDDESSFVSEALINPNGGAVGAFGDTRNSPSDANTLLGYGFVDALLPSVNPLAGPTTAQRLGDALVYGKTRLASIAPPSTDSTTFDELYLWHYFGDPSMQMWGGGTAPRFRPLSDFTATYTRVITGPIQPTPPPYQVNVTLPKELIGQPLALLRDGEVVGKALAGDGVVSIPASFGDGNPSAGQLQVAVDADGEAPITIPVSGAPAATFLTQTCPSSPRNYGATMTTTGQLSGAQAGATVAVTYTRPNGTSFTNNATANSAGAWSSSVTPGDSLNMNTGTWTIQASYAGDSSHAGSTTSPCSIVVTP
jgi:Peptidase family C25/Propeptide_C25